MAAKILTDKSWTELMESPKYDGKDKMFPVTQGMAKEFKDIVTGPADIPTKIYGGLVSGVGTLASPVVDIVGSVGNAALNGYKRAYNYGADLINRQKSNQIDKEIKKFQEKNPNTIANKKIPDDAVTDYQVWKATGQTGYGVTDEDVKRWTERENQQKAQQAQKAIQAAKSVIRKWVPKVQIKKKANPVTYKGGNISL